VETTGLMSDEATDSVILPQSKRNKIFAYLGILIVLLAFGAPSGGLIDIPISFFLKNKLHLPGIRASQFPARGRVASVLVMHLWVRP
jgi:hypothetical protein